MTKAWSWFLFITGCTGTRVPVAATETTPHVEQQEAERMALEAGLTPDAPAPRRNAAPSVEHVPAPVATPENPANPDIVITLRRTLCFGSCPSYRVALRGDGTVEYEGERFVGVRGKILLHRDPAVVAKLAADLEKMGYFSIHIPADCKKIATDHPSAATSVRHGGHTRAIDHDYGNLCMPAELEKMEEAIEQAAGTRSLVECASARCSE